MKVFVLSNDEIVLGVFANEDLAKNVVVDILKDAWDREEGGDRELVMDTLAKFRIAEFEVNTT